MSQPNRCFQAIWVAASCGVMFTAGAWANDFLGSWQISQEFGGQERVSTLTLEEADDGLMGSLTGGRGTSEIENVKVDGDTLTFTRSFERQGQSFDMNYEATIQDGKLVGKVITPRGERPFTGVRGGGDAGFAGEWDVLLDIQGREIPAKLTITESDADGYTGNWSSARGDAALEKVTVADGALSFQRTLERDGQSMTMDHTARIEDGKLVGSISTPMGDLPFTGTRIGGEEAGEVDRAAQMLQRMDADGDGFVSEDEAPEQMKQYFGMIDADGSGGIDKDELEVVVQMMGDRGQN